MAGSNPTVDFPREAVAFEDVDEPLRFQITDFFVPEADKSKKALRTEPPDYKEVPEEYSVLLYGCTEEGHSVCVKVLNYKPYFYLRIPDALLKGKKPEDIKNQLLFYLYDGTYYDQKYKYQRRIVPARLEKHLVSVELVQKKEFMGFTNNALFPYICITVKSLALFNTLKYFFQRPPKEFFDLFSEPFKLYESNIDPMLRFIHDHNILPCGWIELPAYTYSIHDEGTEFARTNYCVQVDHSEIVPLDKNITAPLLIASFDIECTSSHGDFPVAIKDYLKLAKDLVSVARYAQYTTEQLKEWILSAYEKDVIVNGSVKIHRLYAKKNPKTISPENLQQIYDQMVSITDGCDDSSDDDDDTPKSTIAGYEFKMCQLLNTFLPPLYGDAIIQIGTTVHRYGSDKIIYKNILSLKSCDPIPGVEVQCFQTEGELLYAWRNLMQLLDPDILMGYNIFGFDMPYIWDRATELKLADFGFGLGRQSMRRCILNVQKLSSAALGDNILKYFDLDGVVMVDLYKVMQRTPLDSYKLDFVANLYLGDQKNDIKPHEIFEKFKGSSADRTEIAEYCIQDCALVNRLFHKLKVLENNNAMGNVCLVPLSYLFMRGQGVKIFSLVAQFCKNKNYVIPVLKSFHESSLDEENDGYEGAIVLNPKEGMYLEDAITVLDYSSLYPSSMIERNLSHDCYVNDPKYDNLPGVDYCTVTYDLYEGTGDKKAKVGEKHCKFVQLPNGEKGLIPQILMKLLKQRKNTRKKIEYETIVCNDGMRYVGLVTEKDNEIAITDVDKNETATVNKDTVVTREQTYNTFEQAVFDALQLAYKITANSLYGQIGSRVSPIYLKDIAACTTATGRERILMAKKFVEDQYGAEVIYGDTDSIFCKFSHYKENGEKISGRDTLPLGIKAGQRASKEIRTILPPPQCLEYEKTFFPFIIFSKKRYVGLLYEDDANKKPKQKSMGIVLKRRDNAPIVKKIYGGIIDILLTKYDLRLSVDFLKGELQRLVDSKYPLEDLIITKTLRGSYKDRSKIAHCVLADRMGERDPGNKPQINDRIPYIYIQTNGEVKLQGDRIEHPEYVREKGLAPDYQFYITNQLMKPICQLYALCVEKLPDYSYEPGYWLQWDEELKIKPMYDTEIKRKNRIDALREQEVESLLFSPFLEKKRKPAVLKANVPTPTPVTKKKKQTVELAEDAPKLTFKISENKEKKIFEWESVFYLNGIEVWKKENSFPSAKLKKTTACNKVMYEILKDVHEHNSVIEEKGIVFQFDKYYAGVLNRAMHKQDEIVAEIERAKKEADIAAFEECAELFSTIKIVTHIYQFKHKFV